MKEARFQAFSGQPLRIHVDIADGIGQLGVAAHRADKRHLRKKGRQVIVSLVAQLLAQPLGKSLQAIRLFLEGLANVPLLQAPLDTPLLAIPLFAVPFLVIPLLGTSFLAISPFAVPFLAIPPFAVPFLVISPNVIRGKGRRPRHDHRLWSHSSGAPQFTGGLPEATNHPLDADRHEAPDIDHSMQMVGHQTEMQHLHLWVMLRDAQQAVHQGISQRRTSHLCHLWVVVWNIQPSQ